MRVFCLLVLSASLFAAQNAPRVNVGGAVQAARLISSTPPVYPELARQARITGVVRIEVLITTEGTVKDMKLISGHPLLAQSGMDAVRTCISRRP